MKHLFLFLIILVLFSACKTPFNLGHYPLGKTPVATKPFVQLQNKDKIDAHSVKEKADSIIADLHSYAKKDVAFYSTGLHTFGNLGTKFATKMLEGDLNFYSTTTPFHSKSGLRYYTEYYIQKEGSNTISIFNYHSVKKIMLPGDDGYEYLQLFRKNRLWWNLGFYGSIAAELTGVGIGASASNSGKATGNTLIAAGICGMITSAIEVELNRRRNVQKAVARHNHMIE